MVSGIKEGFRIGFNYGCKVVSSKNNVLSALENPQVIEDYFQNEVAESDVEGTSQQAREVAADCGFISARGCKRQWWELCSLTYVSIDAVVESILALGRGALVAKVDVMQAYRNVPVHPEDRHLLAVRWKDELFIDKVLPFGLRSAPLIFTDYYVWLGGIALTHEVLLWCFPVASLIITIHYLTSLSALIAMPACYSPTV